MKQKSVYLPLKGRIGNQLFQYAMARKYQLEMGEGTKIIMDDSQILNMKWENSLVHYNLPDVEYIHHDVLDIFGPSSIQAKMHKFYWRAVDGKNFRSKFNIEKFLNPLFNKFGMVFCENGYIDAKPNKKYHLYLDGYFQSDKYFSDIRRDLLNVFSGEQFEELSRYPGLDKLKNSNSVCISVKVEHNVNNPMFDVCTMEYWEKAIKYITENVENPLFFICSDNVPYVLEHLIDTGKFDYVVQDKDMPVHVSLAAMGCCKHFIIGNTTFGWWAQYLSENEDKIVIAPSRWFGIDVPVDIYQDNWTLIEV